MKVVLLITLIIFLLRLILKLSLLTQIIDMSYIFRKRTFIFLCLNRLLNLISVNKAFKHSCSFFWVFKSCLFIFAKVWNLHSQSLNESNCIFILFLINCMKTINERTENTFVTKNYTTCTEKRNLVYRIQVLNWIFLLIYNIQFMVLEN